MKKIEYIKPIAIILDVDTEDLCLTISGASTNNEESTTITFKNTKDIWMDSSGYYEADKSGNRRGGIWDD